MFTNNKKSTLEMYLNDNYPEILKSINKENYILDYVDFDLFFEIEYENNVVGFITLENDDLNNRLIINESYIVPEYRGNNLFFKNYLDILNNCEKQVVIRKPNKNLINVLLNNDFAFKMPDDIIISYADFIIELKDTYKNSKIKHNYKKVKDDNLTFIANLYDLNLSSVLFFDNSHIYSKKYDVLCVCEARKYDLKKYSIRKKLKKVQPKYLDKRFNIISDNIIEAFDYFKNLNEDFSQSDKIRNKFLNENSEFKDKNLDKISGSENFILNCPFCDEITQKSDIHCHNCGFDLEKTIIKNQDESIMMPIEDNSILMPNDFDDKYEDYFESDKFKEDADEIRSIFDSEEEMKDAFSKLIEATGELALVSSELKKETPSSLNIIDYDYLGLDRDNFDENENRELNIQKSMYALVKYINEHPTPWSYVYYFKSIDDDAFDWIIDKEYITKVMPDQFHELFKDCTVEELIRESESSHNPDTTKEDMINYFIEWCDYSWIVSQKGMDYLNAHPFLEFFTNNLLDFNIYEFKLFADKYEKELTLEEIGDKYINAKLTNALSLDELDVYLNYVDYYFNLNYSKNNYERALLYLIQRLIYEINMWNLKEYHFAFDEVFSIKAGYLLFKITKLNLDFDLEKLYDEAYNSLKIHDIQFNYAENYDILKRLMAGEDEYKISDEMINQAKEQGKFKSLFRNEIIK